MEYKAKVSEAKNWTATASEGKAGQSRVFEPSEEQMLKSRSQTNRRIFQSKIAEAVAHEAEQTSAIVYIGHDSATGLAKLSDTRGNITYAAPITNGAVSKGEIIRARHGSLVTYDAMPYAPQPTKAKPRTIPVAAAVEDYALLYRIREEREGDQPCVCGQSRWFFIQGRIKRICVLFDPSLIDFYRIGQTSIFLNNGGFGFISEVVARQNSSAFAEIDAMSNGFPYGFPGYGERNIISYMTETGTRANISASQSQALSAFNNIQVYARTIYFDLKQKTTFNIKAQFSEPPFTYSRFIAVGIDKIPNSGWTANGPIPGGYDFFVSAPSLDWSVDLDPGIHYLGIGAIFYVGDNSAPISELPISGFYEIDYSLPDITEVDTYYAIASSTSDPVKLVEIRVDEPQRFYLTRTKNQALIALKTGINLDGEWIKISNFAVNASDLQALESINPGTIPTTSSWQSPHIRSYAYNDPNSGDPCINNHKNTNEANIYKNSVISCDLEQIIEGQELKEFLKTSDAEAQISINKISSSEGFCSLGETVYKTIPIAALPIEDGDLSATKITAISPIYSGNK